MPSRDGNPPDSEDMCGDCAYNREGKPPPCCSAICDHSKEQAAIKEGQMTASIMTRALSCYNPSRSIKNSLDANNLTLHMVNHDSTHMYMYSGGLIGTLDNEPSSARGAHRLEVLDNDPNVECCSKHDNTCQNNNNLKCITQGLINAPHVMEEWNLTVPHDLNAGSLALLDCTDKIIGGISVSQHIHPGYFEYKEKSVLGDIAKQVQQSVKKYACFLTHPPGDDENVVKEIEEIKKSIMHDKDDK